MIYGITLAFVASALLLVVLNKFDLPSIPVYLAAGAVTGTVLELFESYLNVDIELFDPSVLQDLIFIGLGFLVFYSISRVVLDKRRETSLDSFKAASVITFSSLALGFGISLFFGFNVSEAFLIGFASAFGSSLANFGFVESEARKDHIYGWIIEDLNLYQDIFAVLAAVIFVITFSEAIPLVNVFLVALFILGALISRIILNKVYLRYELDNEIIMLLGMTTFVGSTLLAEQVGVTALTGILAAGLIFIDTELGFQVRERLSAIRDFFTALSFFAIGLLLTSLTSTALIVAGVLTAYVVVFRPLILIFTLSLQGYDLRTAYLAALGNNEISELTILTGLLLLDAMALEVFTVSQDIFVGLALGFAATMISSHSLEINGFQILEKYFSSYEFEPKRKKLPVKLSDHVILAGFDDKTQGLVEVLEGRDVVAVDYSLERIEEAEELGIYHILGDLNSMKTWDYANYEEANLIISGTSESDVIKMIDDLDTFAKKVTVNSDFDKYEIDDKIREMLKEEIK